MRIDQELDRSLDEAHARRAVAHAIAALATLAMIATHARAAPAPPTTIGVYTRPGDPHATYIETSFGLLVSHDNACSFRWICAAAIAEREDRAPVFRVARDGAMFAATPHGLRVSRDGGCTFTSVTGRIAETWIAGLDIGPTGEVWVTTSDGGKANDVLRSTDGGENFVSAGLRSSTIWWRSVAIAPSRAARVYATGYEVAGAAPRTHVMISDDGGAHWTASALAGVRFAVTPLMLVQAIDRGDPDRVFATSVGAAASGDRLYRSNDGGATWREVLAAGAIRGVTIEGAVVAVDSAPRAFVSKDGGETFTETAKDDERVDRIAGPLACPAGTPQHDRCEPAWPAFAAKRALRAPACPVTRGGCSAGGDGGAIGVVLVLSAARARRRARRASSGSAGSPRARRASGD
jgi:hypothetical protein